MRPDLDDAQGRVFDEARRVVIELANTRSSDDLDSSAAAYIAFLDYARAQGVRQTAAWTLLQSATQTWVVELVHHLAAERDVEISDVLLEMAGSENSRVLEQH